MITTNILQKKKIVIVTLRQTNNNLFTTIATTTFKQALFVTNMKQRFQANSNKLNYKQKLYELASSTHSLKDKKEFSHFNLIQKHYRFKSLIKSNFVESFKATKKLYQKKLKKKKKVLTLTNAIIPYQTNIQNYTKKRAQFLNIIKYRFKFRKYKFKLYQKVNAYNVTRTIRHNMILKQYERHRLFLYRYMHLFNTNNLNLRLLLKTQRVYCEKSNGVIGFKGPKRQTPFASEKLGLKIGRIIKKKRFNNHLLVIILKSPFSNNLRAFFRGFSIVRPKLSYIMPIFKIPHNRMRKRKSRRV